MSYGRIELVRLPAGGSRFTALEADLACRVDQTLNRQRARRPDDERRFRETLRVFTANLAMAAMNRINNRQWLSVSFADADYHRVGLSPTAARQIRTALRTLGLLDVRNGFHSRDGVQAGALTRLRPTDKLKAFLEEAGIHPEDLPRVPQDLIRVRDPIAHLEVEPADVTASGAVLKAVNAVNASAAIFLPDDAWGRAASRYRSRGDEDRIGAGNECAKSLTRIFAGDWSRGGRLYGAFWINLPKEERRHLTINGNPTVELDYRSLHPAILYAKAGLRLDVDPYAVPGYDCVPREQGKRTFNRLLNSESRHHIRWDKIDREHFSSRAEFRAYVQALREHLAPISTFFVTDAADRLNGVRLQREDSDITLGVIQSVSEMGIPILPIHDSFIVDMAHESTLRQTMIEKFVEKYGCEIDVTVK